MSVGDNPKTLEELLAFSLQKLEAMAMDALAVQAEVANEDAPFEVAAAAGDASVFDTLVPSYVWSGSGSDGRVTLVDNSSVCSFLCGFEAVRCQICFIQPRGR